MSQTKSNYAPLLNALDDMKHSPVYAVRRGILQGAMDAIISLEVRLREIEQVPSVAEPGVFEAIYRMAQEFKEAWPEHTGKYHWMIGCAEEFSRAPSHSQQSAEGTPT